MIFSILQTTLLSIILIIIVHYIYIFFKENLTTPKIRDLVNKPTEQYNKIYKDLETKEKTSTLDMKNELQNYLKSLGENNEQNNTTTNNPSDFSFQNEGTNLQYQTL